MPTWLRRILLGLLVVIVLIVVAVALFLPPQIRASYPQIDGEVQLEGLDGPVDVYRDAAGIPHIYATTEHDLFLTQGYVHAQDRFWQMDFQRHTSSGRLSELLGGITLDVDTFLRTLGWERVAKIELENLDAGSLAMLEAYSAGVNAYLAEHEGTEISLEYLFLNLLNSGYEPAPWEPLNTLTWAKAMAWDLRDNMDNEIERAILLKTLSEGQIADLYPPYPEEYPVIVPDFEITPVESVFAPATTQGIPDELVNAFEQLGESIDLADAVLGTNPDADLGSNSWVVSGELSATGAPLMANDPHLGASIPSIWYQIGLHCAPKGPECEYDAVGVSFAGAPGIVLGHNDRIAWAFTNVGPDVMDLFVLVVNPANPHQYEMNGEWIDMQVIEEEIVVAGGETVKLPVRMTVFGPIISDSYGDLADFDETSGLGLPANYAVALSWTALVPGTTFQSIFEMNRAQNFEEFREAARHFIVPSQNLLYADVDGNIGYQMPGLIPVRATGDGRYPAPGWTDEYSWLGYIPFEHLPYSYNPASGYIVTANNPVVDTSYPYQIADYFTYGHRAQRIVDMIENAPGPIDSAYYQEMQGDNLNLGALQIIPYIADMDFGDDKLNEMRDMLSAWDGQDHMDSAPSALFNIFFANLLADGFHDELPEAYWPGGGSTWFVVLNNLLANPQNAWWDNTTTPEVETRDEILQSAFAAGVAEAEQRMGKDPSKWAWGDLHTLTLEHGVMTDFPLINLLFNRGPFRTSGGSGVVNATSWDADSGEYTTDFVPSKRTIMDLSNWENSLQINLVGQSGHAYHPHYMDMVQPWADIEYLPMHWDRAVIEAEAEGHLHLVP
jgi:penicillin amidase